MAVTLKKVTVLHGYYASGDHECFCFDKLDGPDAYPDYDPEDFIGSTDRKIALQNENRVYPYDLLPADGYGRWTITVEFAKLDPPTSAAGASGATQKDVP